MGPFWNSHLPSFSRRECCFWANANAISSFHALSGLQIDQQYWCCGVSLQVSFYFLVFWCFVASSSRYQSEFLSWTLVYGDPAALSLSSSQWIDAKNPNSPSLSYSPPLLLRSPQHLPATLQSSCSSHPRPPAPISRLRWSSQPQPASAYWQWFDSCVPTGQKLLTSPLCSLLWPRFSSSSQLVSPLLTCFCLFNQIKN